ncbi:MAG: hypothetical protein ACTH1Z_10625 [Ancrocorticia sp.]|uniref:hypothetical protein n=1 Tax=Ancrocorticia sp. TaxID=2593684 RepID=UPI003F9325BB
MRRRVAAPLLCSAVCFLLVPAFEPIAAILFIVGFVLILFALVQALVILNPDRKIAWQKFAWLAVAIALGATAATLISTNQISSRSSENEVATNQPQVANSNRSAITASEDNMEKTAENMLSLRDEMVDISGSEKTDAVETAQASEYATASGDSINWQAASVYSFEGSLIVSVPLALEPGDDENLEITNRVTYYLGDDEVAKYRRALSPSCQHMNFASKLG